MITCPDNSAIHVKHKKTRPLSADGPDLRLDVRGGVIENCRTFGEFFLEKD
jgi:hypothetical protein